MTLQYRGSARIPGPLGTSPGTLGGRLPGPLDFKKSGLGQEGSDQDQQDAENAAAIDE